MKGSRQLALLWGVVALVCLAALPLAPQLVPGLAACPIRSHSGWPCPSCGATRVMLALSDLDPLAALEFNPLVTLAFLGFVGAGLGAAAWTLVGRPLPVLPRQLPAAVRAAAAALLLLNWLYLVARGA